MNLNRRLVFTDIGSTLRQKEEVKMSKLLETPKRWIGVDLHKTQFTVCYMHENGEYEMQEFRVSEAGFEEFRKSLRAEDSVAVESTGNTGYFIEQIKGLVSEVKIINPLQFKIISTSVKKTDERDAVIMARYLSKGLIPEVRMRSKEQRQLSSLINTRDKLVKLRTSLKNKIHNIFNENGIVTKREVYSSDKALRKVLEIPLDSSYRFELGLIVKQVQQLNESIKEADRKIEEEGQKLKGHKNITSITGIGDKTAAILLNKIGDVNDFSEEKKLDAYLGIVPSVSQSNEKCFYGPITKMGDKIARTALVQATLTVIKYNDYLRNFYLKLKTKKGHGKAIIATARKYLHIIYKTLKYNWVFKDFNKFELAENIG